MYTFYFFFCSECLDLYIEEVLVHKARGLSDCCVHEHKKPRAKLGYIRVHVMAPAHREYKVYTYNNNYYQNWKNKYNYRTVHLSANGDVTMEFITFYETSLKWTNVLYIVIFTVMFPSAG